MIFIAQEKNDLFNTEKVDYKALRLLESIQSILIKEKNELDNLLNSIKVENRSCQTYIHDIVQDLDNMKKAIQQEDRLLSCVGINDSINKVNSDMITLDKQNKSALRKIFHSAHTTESQVNDLYNFAVEQKKQRANDQDNIDQIKKRLTDLENNQNKIMACLDRILNKLDNTNAQKKSLQVTKNTMEKPNKTTENLNNTMENIETSDSSLSIVE